MNVLSASKRWKESNTKVPLRNYADMILKAKDKAISGKEEHVGKFTLHKTRKFTQSSFVPNRIMQIFRLKYNRKSRKNNKGVWKN